MNGLSCILPSPAYPFIGLFTMFIQISILNSRGCGYLRWWTVSRNIGCLFLLTFKMFHVKQFKSGDTILCIKSVVNTVTGRIFFTKGKRYEIKFAHPKGLDLIDDGKNNHGVSGEFMFEHFDVEEQNIIAQLKEIIDKC